MQGRERRYTHVDSLREREFSQKARNPQYSHPYFEPAPLSEPLASREAPSQDHAPFMLPSDSDILASISSYRPTPGDAMKERRVQETVRILDALMVQSRCKLNCCIGGSTETPERRDAGKCAREIMKSLNPKDRTRAQEMFAEMIKTDLRCLPWVEFGARTIQNYKTILGEIIQKYVSFSNEILDKAKVDEIHLLVRSECGRCSDSESCEVDFSAVEDAVTFTDNHASALRRILYLLLQYFRFDHRLTMGKSSREPELKCLQSVADDLNVIVDAMRKKVRKDWTTCIRKLPKYEINSQLQNTWRENVLNFWYQLEKGIDAILAIYVGRSSRVPGFASFSEMAQHAGALGYNLYWQPMDQFWKALPDFVPEAFRRGSPLVKAPEKYPEWSKRVKEKSAALLAPRLQAQDQFYPPEIKPRSRPNRVPNSANTDASEFAHPAPLASQPVSSQWNGNQPPAKRPSRKSLPVSTPPQHYPHEHPMPHSFPEVPHPTSQRQGTGLRRSDVLPPAPRPEHVDPRGPHRRMSETHYSDPLAVNSRPPVPLPSRRDSYHPSGPIPRVGGSSAAHAAPLGVASQPVPRYPNEPQISIVGPRFMGNHEASRDGKARVPGRYDEPERGNVQPEVGSSQRYGHVGRYGQEREERRQHRSQEEHRRASHHQSQLGQGAGGYY
ncbi:hypothetical protein BJ508DRAFT_35147 [Ascobolus immersus RN42]|uniref:Uncharacterized protein n=1 Tax=Ascobolus immersus RN42 TaxID=1160509 RepID=A0A3N4HME0_ASCIM|nr:hypothetical protein BJ508DRAFT_35147 [Ascobolus immersus RN42]